LDVLVALNDEILAVVFAEALVDQSQLDELAVEDERTLRRLFSVEKGRATEVLAERLALRLSSADARERRRAHQALVALGGSAVTPLVGALAEPTRRHAACAALGELRDTSAVPALISLLEDGDADSRAVAARTLGAIRDPRSLDALVGAGNDGDADVRDAALDALDRFGAVVDVLGTAAFADSIDKRLGRIEADRARPLDDRGGPQRERPAPSFFKRFLGKRSS
jgi:HEAT repeat protein